MVRPSRFLWFKVDAHTVLAPIKTGASVSEEDIGAMARLLGSIRATGWAMRSGLPLRTSASRRRRWRESVAEQRLRREKLDGTPDPSAFMSYTSVTDPGSFHAPRGPVGVPSTTGKRREVTECMRTKTPWSPNPRLTGCRQCHVLQPPEQPIGPLELELDARHGELVAQHRHLGSVSEDSSPRLSMSRTRRRAAVLDRPPSLW
jgi:hypothetical protein